MGRNRFIVTVTGTKEYTFSTEELRKAPSKQSQDKFYREYDFEFEEITANSTSGDEHGAVVEYEASFGVRDVGSKESAIEHVKDFYDVPDAAEFSARKL